MILLSVYQFLRNDKHITPANFQKQMEGDHVTYPFAAYMEFWDNLSISKRNALYNISNSFWLLNLATNGFVYLDSKCQFVKFNYKKPSH